MKAGLTYYIQFLTQGTNFPMGTGHALYNAIEEAHERYYQEVLGTGANVDKALRAFNWFIVPLEALRTPPHKCIRKMPFAFHKQSQTDHLLIQFTPFVRRTWYPPAEISPGNEVISNTLKINFIVLGMMTAMLRLDHNIEIPEPWEYNKGFYNRLMTQISYRSREIFDTMARIRQGRAVHSQRYPRQYYTSAYKDIMAVGVSPAVAFALPQGNKAIIHKAPEIAIGQCRFTPEKSPKM